MNEKWLYAFDSLSIFDSDTDKITKFSFSQLNEFYEEKVKKLRPKDIKQTAEVLNDRKQLTIQVNQLKKRFQELLVQQENLYNQENAIEEYTKKINEAHNNYQNKKKEIDKMKQEERLKALQQLNNKMDKEIKSMKTKKKQKIKTLKLGEGLTTHCDKCKNNCHSFWFFLKDV